MVNAGDLFICFVAGLAVPLALLDGFKAVGGSALPAQPGGFQFERRPVVWLLAIVLGPGHLRNACLLRGETGNCQRQIGSTPW